MTFNIALSGLNAASQDLAVTANNIANVSTTGFKGSRAEFADMFPISPYGVAANAAGAGVRTSRVAQQFEQGSINFTNNSLDLAISGGGFFTLSDNGAHVYTRAGAFGTDRNGFVVNAQQQRLQVYPPFANGTGFDTARMTDLQLATTDNPPRATSSVGVAINLPASATAPVVTPFDAADPNSYNQSTSVTVFDSLGASHAANLYFVRGAAANSWEVYTQIDGNTVSGPDPLVYSNTGTLLTPATGDVAIPAYDPGNGAAPISFTLDLGTSTQFGDSFSLNSLTQDGYTTGRLTGIEITQEGIAQARYTNGQATPIGQLAMTTFANAQGLQQLGDTTWGETFAAGQPQRGIAGATNFGLIQSGALEASNVDLTEQLVNMITAQRNFQANSQMVSTSDQITQTIINIR